MIGRYTDQAEADEQYMGRKQKIWFFGKQWTPVINVRALILRSSEWYVTTPLVSYYPVAQEPMDGAQNLGVEKEFWSKTRRFKGHRQKMPISSSVRLSSMIAQVVIEMRPQRLSASMNPCRPKVCSEYAEAVFP